MDDIVCGLLVRPTGEVLVGLRSGHKRAYPSYWDVFGGHVERGETFEAALARELREELGIAVTDFTAIGTLSEQRPEIHGPSRYHFYLVRGWRGEPWNACDEHVTIDWFSPREALTLDNLTDGAREVIAAITPAGAPSP